MNLYLLNFAQRKSNVAFLSKIAHIKTTEIY